MNRNLKTSPGSPLPLGASYTKDGVQFSLFSRHATAVQLLLFNSSGDDSDCIEIDLDPQTNKTGDIWHIRVENIQNGQLYGYKVDGPYEPLKGHRFNRNKLIIDPYARAVSDNGKKDFNKSRGYNPESPDHDLSFSVTDSTPFIPKSIYSEKSEEARSRSLNLPESDYIIYELHVKGFTFHNSSGVTKKGTFKGLTEKIPYLKELGVTAVELMPVQEFDENENININPLTGDRLKNYWGYSTVSFFAPKGSYSSSGAGGEQILEFKEMVKAFHDEGIEVILDVVFNHTAEGDEKGPTISFRGIDNSIYYILEDNKRFYKNYSGCGNTVNCNHPLVRSFILDALRYWVIEMNVDGFRFDLASILGRDQKGKILSNPPLIERIEEDPILRNTKIIAEAWDAAGAYQLGVFPGRWAEWNGRYRDDVRKFWRGDKNTVGYFATRLTGSSDLYQHSENGSFRSINFITCHDGFTLNDLVSYNHKHNIENGEDNRDGENHNLSSNLGIEGNDITPYIKRMRNRQIKNFIATLFLSQGIPMLLAGDEMRRTQNGNNNTYCQDNDLSWIDWTLIEKNSEIFRFTREMIRFRKEHPILRRKAFFKGASYDDKSSPDISWHGTSVNNPDWSQTSNAIGVLLNGAYAECETGPGDSDVYMFFNAAMTGRFFTVPDSPSGNKWKIAVNTALESPVDIYASGTEPLVKNQTYFADKMSAVVLIT